MISEGIEPPLHTLQGWASRGYKIKKGEHAVAETKLWKKKKKRIKLYQKAEGNHIIKVQQMNE